MKTFLKEHPFVAGIVIFLCVFIGGSVVTFILPFAIMAMRKAPRTASPNDGDAMAIGMIWMLGMFLSLIASIIAGIIAAVILKIKQ